MRSPGCVQHAPEPCVVRRAHHRHPPRRQLLDALRQAEDLTGDPAEKTALRKAGGGHLATVSRCVVAEVIAASTHARQNCDR